MRHFHFLLEHPMHYQVSLYDGVFHLRKNYTEQHSMAMSQGEKKKRREGKKEGRKQKEERKQGRKKGSKSKNNKSF